MRTLENYLHFSFATISPWLDALAAAAQWSSHRWIAGIARTCMRSGPSVMTWCSVSSFIGIELSPCACVCAPLFSLYWFSFSSSCCCSFVGTQFTSESNVPLIRNKFFQFSSALSVVAQSKPRFFYTTQINVKACCSLHKYISVSRFVFSLLAFIVRLCFSRFVGTVCCCYFSVAVNVRHNDLWFSVN